MWFTWVPHRFRDGSVNVTSSYRCFVSVQRPSQLFRAETVVRIDLVYIRPLHIRYFPYQPGTICRINVLYEKNICEMVMRALAPGDCDPCKSQAMAWGAHQGMRFSTVTKMVMIKGFACYDCESEKGDETHPITQNAKS